jgi:3D (Asp-Asp-Asp) domain-containing protein
MRHSLLTAFILVPVLALPAQAKHTKHTSNLVPATTPVTVSTTISKPLPLVRSLCSTKVARTFLPENPKPAVKPALVAQVKPADVPAPAKTMVDATATSDAGTPQIDQPLPKGALARITAYWTDEDYYTSQHMSSTGVKLHEGHCAVDPSLIPYGSVVKIPGMGSYVAVDTGSAVVSREAAVGAAHNADEKNALVVDLFFENRHEAEEFAAHGPSYVAVSWKRPLTAADAPMNPRALPADSNSLEGTAQVRVYVLESAPSLADCRLPLNFRSPTIFQ